jgi:hypothetical protein
MKQQLYWTFVTRDGWLEFHVSRDRREVQDLEALSRRVKCSSKHRPSFVEDCLWWVKTLKMKEVEL